jgi:hypothetical protein
MRLDCASSPRRIADWWQDFPSPYSYDRNERHLSFHSMNGSGTDAQSLGRFEDARAGRQLLADALDDIGTHRTTPQPFPLAPRPCKAERNSAAQN